MRVGYLPDMFGHVAQMPQILRAAGIETAVVWRGVPAAVDFHRFVWEGIDGSSVVAEYLPGGYGNAAYIFDVPGPVDLGPFEERFRPWFASDPVLGHGRDRPQAARARLLGARPRRRDGRHARRTTSRTPRRTGSSRWRGEMRSGRAREPAPGRRLRPHRPQGGVCPRANGGSSVTPSRCRRSTADRLAGAVPAQAWTRMFQNSAHDSICGCSDGRASRRRCSCATPRRSRSAASCAQRAVARIAAEVPHDAFADRESVAARAHRPRRARAWSFPTTGRRSSSSFRTARACRRRRSAAADAVRVEGEARRRGGAGGDRTPPARPRALRPNRERLSDRGRVGRSLRGG